MLTFSGPMELTVVLAFNPGAQFGLVDQIIRAKGLYLQVGRPGDRLIILTRQKVIANIPDTGLRGSLAGHFFRAAVKQARAGGLNRRQAKEAAREFIANWRKFGNFRMESRPPSRIGHRPDTPKAQIYWRAREDSNL